LGITRAVALAMAVDLALNCHKQCRDSSIFITKNICVLCHLCHVGLTMVLKPLNQPCETDLEPDSYCQNVDYLARNKFSCKSHLLGGQDIAKCSHGLRSCI